MQGTVIDAALWTFVAMFPVVIAAWVGIAIKPDKKIIGSFLGISSGMLIALLSYELMEEAFRESGPVFAVIGFFLGLGVYQGLNYIVYTYGVKRRQSIICGGIGHLSVEQQSERNTGIALVMGAVLDGIPESMTIGISFLKNPLVSAPIILAVAIANIPEGMASGVGLYRSGFSRKKILLIWVVVVAVCVLSSIFAYLLLQDAPDKFKGAIVGFAGGGVLAMTLQTVVPEAYKEIKDWIGILGGVGFIIAFIFAHYFH
jgi:zinc transporter, ZIP family